MGHTDNKNFKKKVNNNNKCNKHDDNGDKEEDDDDSDTTTEEIGYESNDSGSENEKDDIILEKQITDNIKTLSLLKLRNDTPKSSPSTSRSSSFTTSITTNKTTTTTSTITPKKQQTKQQHVHTQKQIQTNTNTPSFNKNTYKTMFIVLIISISFIYFINFQKTTNTTTNTIDNNEFKNLINKFKFTKEFEPFKVSLNSQISNNNLQLKQNVNYKRPISIHISTNNIDNAITYINNLFNDTTINSVNQFNDFSKSNHKNILQIINKNTKSNNNNNHNSIFIFKINTTTSTSSNSNNDKIDLGFIEKILEGGTYNNEPSIKNLSMNNMFLVVSNIGQLKILNNTTLSSTTTLDKDTKLEIVIKESKLKFAHRLVHRIRDTIIILFNK